MALPEYVDVLLPGFIEADSHIQFGAPCLVGTRVPFYVGLGWVAELIDNSKGLKANRITREQAIALAAFHAGFNWHKQRNRRKCMDDAVRDLWAEINRKTMNEHATAINRLTRALDAIIAHGGNPA